MGYRDPSPNLDEMTQEYKKSQQRDKLHTVPRNIPNSSVIFWSAGEHIGQDKDQYTNRQQSIGCLLIHVTHSTIIMTNDKV
jgi:hypothetical protein